MPTAEQIREWEHGNAHFPDHLVQVPSEHWPESPSETGGTVIAAYRSNAFVVIAWQEPSGFTRLSVNRTEWDSGKGRFRDNIAWDDLQRLKSEAGFGNVPAVEVYPPDQHILNTANLRHLFLLEAPPPFMWVQDEQGVKSVNSEAA